MIPSIPGRRRAHAFIRTSSRALALAALGAAASAHAAPYVWWSSAVSSRFDGYQIDFNPNVDPGPASNVYWASQYWMPDGEAAYFGMQTPREGGTGLILWSVWSATAAVTDGSPGTACSTFNEGTPGYTCRMRLAWKAGNTYRFNLQYLGDNWYRNTVSEVQTGRVFDLGRIRAKTPGVTGGVNWTEYYDWNDTGYDWDGAPDGKMTWTRLQISTGEVLTMSPELPQQDNERFTVSPDGKTVSLETWVGRSQELPLLNPPSHQCLGLVSGSLKPVACPISTDPGPPDRNQTWTFTNAAPGGKGQIHAYDACLMSDGPDGGVRVTSPCSSTAAAPAEASVWIDKLAVDGTLRPDSAPGKCLTLAGSSVKLKPCNGSDGQQWRQTDDTTQAYWALADTQVKVGGDLVFKLQLSRPASQASWTRIMVDRSSAPAVADFWNDSQQVSLDGVTWGTLTVYYGDYVALPAGATQLYVRLKTSSATPLTQPQKARLLVQEMAGGDFKAMAGPDAAVGKVKP